MTDQELTPISVPPMGKEPHFWHPDSDAYLSRSERVRETGEYWSAIPASIAGLSVIVSTDIGGVCSCIRRARYICRR